MLDTSSEAREVQLEAVRRMPPEERLQRGLELTELVRELLAAGVRARHPEYSPEEVRLTVIRIVLGEELFRAAYPHASHIKP